MDDRAIFCTDGGLAIDSALFKRPDSGHRTSPWLPLRLHTVDSARDRYNIWAAAEWDRNHGGPGQSYIGEDGIVHPMPKPTNPYRAEEVSA